MSITTVEAACLTDVSKVILTDERAQLHTIRVSWTSLRRIPETGARGLNGKKKGRGAKHLSRAL